MRERKLAAAFLALCAMGMGGTRQRREGFGNRWVQAHPRRRHPAADLGREFSDGVHWRYSFQPGGALTEYA